MRNLMVKWFSDDVFFGRVRIEGQAGWPSALPDADGARWIGKPATLTPREQAGDPIALHEQAVAWAAGSKKRPTRARVYFAGAVLLSHHAGIRAPRPCLVSALKTAWALEPAAPGFLAWWVREILRLGVVGLGSRELDWIGSGDWCFRPQYDREVVPQSVEIFARIVEMALQTAAGPELLDDVSLAQIAARMSHLSQMRRRVESAARSTDINTAMERLQQLERAEIRLQGTIEKRLARQAGDRPGRSRRASAGSAENHPRADQRAGPATSSTAAEPAAPTPKPRAASAATTAKE